jgi:hypothetical protein
MGSCASHSGFAVVRNGDYFESRFFTNPIASYDVYTISQGDILVGAFVLRQHTVVEGRRDLCLADWMYERTRLSVFVAVVDFTIREGGARRCDVVTAWRAHTDADTAVLMAAGFQRVWDLTVVFAPGPVEARIVGTSALDFTIASSDNI